MNAAVPTVVRHRLASGLMVWAVRDDSSPLVLLLWTSPWGPACDPAGREGLAALAAKLLPDGPAASSEAARSVAAELFAGSDWHGAFVGLALLAEDLETGLVVLCTAVREPACAAEALERRRRWQLAELGKRQRPATRADDALARALFPHGRQGSPLVGTGRGLRSVQQADVEVCQHRFGSPRHGGLIAVGRCDPEVLVRRLDALLTAGGAAGPAPAADENGAAGARRALLLDAPAAAQTELRLGWRGPAPDEPGAGGFPVLAEVLGTRLQRRLRERHGYVYAVRCRLEERPGAAPLVAALATGHGDAGKVLAEARCVVDELSSQACSAAEIRQAVERLDLGALSGLQTLQGRARRLRILAAGGRTGRGLARQAAETRTLSPAGLAEFARRFLAPDRVALAAVGPADRLRRQLEPFGFADQEPGLEQRM